MKLIKVEAIDKIIDSLVIGACNTEALANICELEDGGSDIIIETREEAAEMHRQAKILREWRK